MRLRIALFILTTVPVLSGCGTMRATIGGWGQDADGLSRPQGKLRAALASADFPAALAFREDDAMLRMLSIGTAAFYAAQYERSASLLDTAALLSDERLTTSLSRGALSLVTNDMARLYRPRRTERLFIPYYGMLSYARLGQWEGAAVEARRMASLLAQFGGDRDDAERELHAGMHYLAGTVFERAGETEASAVAYRNAHALASRYPEQPVAGDTARGEVLVIVERGFVAHRTTESIHIALNRDERDALRGSDDERRGVIDRIRARVGPASPAPEARIGAAAFRQRATAAAWLAADSPAIAGRSAEQDDDDDEEDDLHHLRLAFPALRRSPRPWAGAPRLLVDSAEAPRDTLAVQAAVDVDDASAVDERRERAGMVMRELARAAAKYAVTRAVRDKTGKVGGTIAEVGAALLERADVRSWHLLPQEVVLMRVRLPAGTHALRVEAGDGANRREVDLGLVTVAGGSVAIVAARLWDEPAPRTRARCEFIVLECPR